LCNLTTILTGEIKITYQLIRKSNYWRVSFSAMASPCEVLVWDSDKKNAEKIAQLVQKEALRIELKFSRFIKDNIIDKINHAEGEKISIDAETYRLFSFADECHQLSGGMFDITSGLLKSIWNFKKLDSLPQQKDLDAVLKNIGWQQVDLSKHAIQLPKNMQIDLGGIGKEYAVDSCVALLNKNFSQTHVLVNFGGDLCTTQAAKTHWQVGIEGFNNRVIKLQSGALATSGQTKQFIMDDDKRFSHIINPKTGWPIEGAPLSVTVLAENTSHAGMLATFAQLQGKNAEKFLSNENVKYWILP
jgi:thiamine biosynthesis lipoprotein